MFFFRGSIKARLLVVLVNWSIRLGVVLHNIRRASQPLMIQIIRLKVDLIDPI